MEKLNEKEIKEIVEIILKSELSQTENVEVIKRTENRFLITIAQEKKEYLKDLLETNFFAKITESEKGILLSF